MAARNDDSPRSVSPDPTASRPDGGTSIHTAAGTQEQGVGSMLEY